MASQQAAGQHGRQARSALGGATRAMASLAARLRAKSARKTIDADVRTVLLKGAVEFQRELRALRTAL